MSDQSLRLGLLTLGMGLLPSLVAIWCVPDFVPQDGPAHLYNAVILARSVEANSPYASAFVVNFQPLPNWAGHLILWGLLKILSPWGADRVVFSLTLVALSASIVWLRYQVAGSQALAVTSVVAIILGLNVTWLLGFSSFLLGAALFPITLGYWWGGRNEFGPWRALGLGLLMILGYASHLVSLGLTLVGVLILACFTPGPNRYRTGIWTAAGLAPIVPLLGIYKWISNQGGPLHPEWQYLFNPFSISAWINQLGWVDPISLASKVVVPFVAEPSNAYALITPVAWFVLGMTLMGVDTFKSGKSLVELRGWLILSAVLILGGLLGPDSLGPSHGHYLPQRILLLGLVAITPCLGVGGPSWTRSIGIGAIGVALIMQTLFVWEYALASQQTVGAIRQVANAVGHDQRIASILVDIRGRSRANPLLHADNLLGIGTGNIIWNNYETNHYYFPVQFRAGLDRPPALELEQITKLDSSPSERAHRWERILAQYHQSIDILVMWGTEPQIDAINDRWFETSFINGPVRVLRHRREMEAVKAK